MRKSKKKEIAFYIAVFVVATIIVYIVRMNMNLSAASSSWSAGSEFGHSMWIAAVVTFIVWVIKKIIYSI